ncbi:MAG TPA: O-antigen ligase family protein [candidate division Zixibacteria bacterium]|nr:O-antigen ligase family protein [candidate division Zixibacteria bacterium]
MAADRALPVPGPLAGDVPARERPAALSAVLAIAAASVFAIVLGYLVADGDSELALVLATALPAVLLVVRYPFAGILLWLLVMPFFVRLGSEQPSIVMWGLHRLGLPALLVLLVLLHVLGLRKRDFRLHVVDVFLVLLLAIGVFNVLFFSPNPIRMLASFYDKVAMPIVLFWLVRVLAPGKRELGYLVAVGGVTIVVQSIIGVMSWTAPALLPEGWLGRAGERTVGTLGGPAPYTITLVFFAMLALYWSASVADRRSPVRPLLAMLVLVAMLATFLSLSRGSWLGACLAFGGLVFVYPRVTARVGTFAVVIFLVLLAAVAPFREQVLFAQERLGEVDTIESRIVTNDAALRMMTERPLTGFGFGNFEAYDEAYKQRVGDIPLKLGGSAHNTYLNLAVELGLPATVLYLGVPLWLLATTLRRRTQLKRAGAETWALVVVLWLILADQFAVSNFLEMIHPNLWGTALWWITLGMIFVVLDRVRNETSPSPRPGAATFFAA